MGEAIEAGQARNGLSVQTLRRLEYASGGLATASIASMQSLLPWFRRLPADQRASILLIIQAGVANFIVWLSESESTPRVTAEGFLRAAPKDLSRWMSLRQTVELVRIAIDVFERRLPELAADDAERAVLTEGILRFGREIAFTAATSYAAAAEARGAWDARLESLIVDGVVRGDAEESLLSRASALGWDQPVAATVLVGNPPSTDPPAVLYEVRSRAARVSRPVLLGVHGSRLVVVLGGMVDAAEERDVLLKISEGFGDGPVVAGPTVESLADAHRSAEDALSGLRAVVAWPAAPRPVRSTDLLPERALAGDPGAERQLVEQVMMPLAESSGGLLETVQAYLEVGGVLEACAKTLFVHPNTVRYRLRRVAELTGYNPADPRDALVLQVALKVGRLAHARGLW
ncbi:MULTISPECIES: PucR family transcriptional regulator [Actinoalloteichus]|uniref:Regulator of polyketide synthase expression n=1 Tax=Actinoalloteichus fjordicus TaxID=1612552 RepID=A0AAC9PUL5_9PSEU|nr:MULTISPECIES: PucR family transcriptional regulator [Actinoalloteichus]APU17091.1 regulator of polyketide synthase expression [Actinoalloteichus fjordicus]APU23172.1 regulator of polyketide synthase expression [Actinoalloteichus sp. GBA129-24]